MTLPLYQHAFCSRRWKKTKAEKFAGVSGSGAIFHSSRRQREAWIYFENNFLSRNPRLLEGSRSFRLRLLRKFRFSSSSAAKSLKIDKQDFAFSRARFIRESATAIRSSKSLSGGRLIELRQLMARVARLKALQSKRFWWKETRSQ